MLVITKKRFLGPLIVTWFLASIYVIFVTTNDRINEVRVLNIEGVNSDNFINSLGKVVKGKRKIREDIRVGSNKRKSACSCGEEPSILTKVKKSYSLGRTSERLETVTKGVPFL